MAICCPAQASNTFEGAVCIHGAQDKVKYGKTSYNCSCCIRKPRWLLLAVAVCDGGKRTLKARWFEQHFSVDSFSSKTCSKTHLMCNIPSP